MYDLAIPAFFVSAALFGAAAYFTRARVRRIAAALLAGICGAILNVGWDLLAAPMGWWRYSVGPSNHAPWIMYAPVVLWFGAGIGLVGWRMIRSWGLAGALVFFAAFSIVGYARDRLYDARADVFHLGEGIAPHLADAFAWLSIAVLVQVVMRAVAGPPHADQLRTKRSRLPLP